MGATSKTTTHFTFSACKSKCPGRDKSRGLALIETSAHPNGRRFGLSRTKISRAVECTVRDIVNENPALPLNLLDAVQQFFIGRRMLFKKSWRCEGQNYQGLLRAEHIHRPNDGGSIDVTGTGVAVM